MASLIDELTLELTAGKGGNGVVRWRREKNIDKGGPAGGNGGRGGHVYAESVSDLAYLEYYRHQKIFRSQDGQAGQGHSLEGYNGEDLVLKFPRGTVIRHNGTGEEWSLDTVGMRVQLLSGGKGGYGNKNFKSSRNTTPYQSTPGVVGERGEFFIELQLFADIGLVGLPSAGKSTLLNMLTNAKSKVAAYHFTTLDPHLGVLPGGKILADLPGIIEGASEGKGLGYKFLKHIQRTNMIAHVVSCEHEDVVAIYEGIRNELKRYGKGLDQKDEIIILSKIDMHADDEKVWQQKQRELEKHTGKSVIAISAYDDTSIKKLNDILVK